VATQHDDGTVVVWNLQTEVPLLVLPAVARPNGMTFSRDGRWLAVADDTRIRVHDADGRAVRDLRVTGQAGVGAWRPPLRQVGPIAFTPDGRRLLVAADDGLVRLLDVRGAVLTTWQHPSAVTALGLVADGLVTGCADGRVSTWGWDGRLLRRGQHAAAVRHIDVGAAGSVVATASDDGAVRFWDGHAAVLGELQLPERPVGVAVLADGKRALTATSDGALAVWPVGSPPEGGRS
jgi:WD40 repeat protein